MNRKVCRRLAVLGLVVSLVGGAVAAEPGVNRFGGENTNRLPGDNPAPAPPAAEPAPVQAVAAALAAPKATFPMLVDCLAAGDPTNFYAALTPELKQQVDLPVLQIVFDVLLAELGPLQQKRTEAYQETAGESNGQAYVDYIDTLVFARGTAELTATISDDEFYGFNVDAPQLGALDGKIYGRAMELLTAGQQQAQPLADVLGGRCEQFVDRLFQGSASAAYESLHPAVQAAMPREEALPKIESMRSRFGPIAERRFETLGVVGSTPGQYDCFTVRVAMKRENGKPVQGNFTLQLAGLQGVIVEFRFSEETDLLSPAEAAPQ